MEFDVTGGYSYQGTEGRTQGSFQIQDGQVSGELVDQGPGGRSVFEVDGTVMTQETLDDTEIPILKFLKEPEHPMKADVSWLLEKTEEVNDPYTAEADQLAGEYEGEWSFNTDRDLIVAGTQYDPEMGVSMAIDENPDTEGEAYLTLNPV
jgi:hypothetical protein